MEDKVILVDAADRVVGTMDKMEAHLEGALHRAFSVFVFNSKNELLLQQRAFEKYHSGGKWTNTCCSHPLPDEDTLSGAHRRLMEEMGMNCELIYGFNFTYKAMFSNNLIEHEFDHVFFGRSDELPVPNPEEVAGYRYVGLAALKADVQAQPDIYSAWLNECLEKVIEFKNTHDGILDC